MVKTSGKGVASVSGVGSEVTLIQQGQLLKRKAGCALEKSKEELEAMKTKGTSGGGAGSDPPVRADDQNFRSFVIQLLNTVMINNGII